jgi:hypothetical protein
MTRLETGHNADKVYITRASGLILRFLLVLTVARCLWRRPLSCSRRNPPRPVRPAWRLSKRQ